MLDVFFNSAGKYCERRSRRDFLKIGALTGVGLSLSSLLKAEADSPTRSPARARSVILVYLGGGLSHHDSFDLKPDAAEEVRWLDRAAAAVESHIGRAEQVYLGGLVRAFEHRWREVQERKAASAAPAGGP